MSREGMCMAIDGDEVCACHGKLEAYEQMAEALREIVEAGTAAWLHPERLAKARAALRVAGGEWQRDVR